MVGTIEAKPMGRKSRPAPRSGEVPASLNAAALSMSPADLAELLTTFNEATGKLQAAHETLTAEVARLEKELRGTNRQLRRARQLAALGEMAAGIAHEVRNPLGSIKLYARVLAEDLSHMPEQAGVAGKIIGAVDRLNAVVGDVLNFSREISVRAARVTAWDIVEPAFEGCRELAKVLGVSIELDEAVLRTIPVCADAGLLTQAFTNVLRNACEAVGECGREGEKRVTVTAERRRVVVPGGGKVRGAAERVDAAALIVRDNGPGVPEEALARVFNPFFTTRHTGTGLGLAIVHRIVDAHGGSVHIRNNTPEPGATVELVVPEVSDPTDSADSSELASTQARAGISAAQEQD